MLRRKMFREIKENFGQFFSIFILSALAIALYVMMQCNYVGASKALVPFHQASNLADGWLYGENFTQENLVQVRKLMQITAAQLRMLVTGSAPGQDGAEVDLILEEENIVNKPYLLEGEEFDPEDTEGVWLSQRFADAWDIRTGDLIELSYNGITFEKEVKGLVAAPEYEYMCASKDLETDFRNIAYAYMSYRGFPAKDYVLHLIDTEDITVEYVLEHTQALDQMLEQLKAYGMTAKDITQQMLKEHVEQLEEEQIFAMLPYTQLIFTTEQEDVLALEESIRAAIDENYAVFVDRSSIPGIQNFADELNQHRQFSYGFSLVFVLIALLVIMTTMGRMVDRQRTQIGTLNAMGMRRYKIMLHYIGYSFVISLAGCAAGLLLGMFWLGQWLVRIFQGYYTVPGWKAGYHYSYLVMSLVIVAVCTGASWFCCRRLLFISPSQALRPAPPKSGKHCIFERLPFWRRLGFSARYNLRDISRAKLRSFMGIFGTACGMMLMACGIGCNDTLDNVLEWNFEKLQNYDYELVLEEAMKLSDADALADSLDGELIMASGVEIAAAPKAVSAQKATCTLIVTEGKGYFGITDRQQNLVRLEEGTVAVTMKLAKRLDLEEGDTVYWHIYEQNDWHEAKVGVINRNPGITGITMLREDFEQTGCTYHPTSLYTNMDVSGYQEKGVSAVHNSEAIREAYKSSMEVMYLMVAMLVVFSGLLVVVVLYNSGNLSFHERIKEFATLKVMGFRSGQIRGLLSRQNLGLSLIGIFLGAPFGRGLLQYMFDSNGDSYDYQAVIHMDSYVITAVLVLGISVLVSFLFSKRIKRLDMVEVLKGME